MEGSESTLTATPLMTVRVSAAFCIKQNHADISDLRRTTEYAMPCNDACDPGRLLLAVKTSTKNPNLLFELVVVRQPILHVLWGIVASRGEHIGLQVANATKPAVEFKHKHFLTLSAIS